jgi:hypothetical protein
MGAGMNFLRHQATEFDCQVIRGMTELPVAGCKPTQRRPSGYQDGSCHPTDGSFEARFDHCNLENRGF